MDIGIACMMSCGCVCLSSKYDVERPFILCLRSFMVPRDVACPCHGDCQGSVVPFLQMMTAASDATPFLPAVNWVGHASIYCPSMWPGLLLSSMLAHINQ